MPWTNFNFALNHYEEINIYQNQDYIKLSKYLKYNDKYCFYTFYKAMKKI